MKKIELTIDERNILSYLISHAFHTAMDKEINFRLSGADPTITKQLSEYREALDRLRLKIQKEDEPTNA